MLHIYQSIIRCLANGSRSVLWDAEFKSIITIQLKFPSILEIKISSLFNLKNPRMFRFRNLVMLILNELPDKIILYGAS